METTKDATPTKIPAQSEKLLNKTEETLFGKSAERNISLMTFAALKAVTNLYSILQNKMRHHEKKQKD